MTDFKPGEIVNVEIKGARIAETHDDGSLIIQYAAPGQVFDHAEIAEMYLVSDNGAVTITRAAPAEWPPQPGDLWRSGDGVWDNEWNGMVWLAFHGNPNEPGLNLMSTRGSLMFQDDLLREYGPLALVHREPACAVCGSAKVVYRNYQDMPFCAPCADGRPVQARAKVEENDGPGAGAPL